MSFEPKQKSPEAVDINLRNTSCFELLPMVITTTYIVIVFGNIYSYVTTKYLITNINILRSTTE